MSPTARARYRRRPVNDQLARGDVDRYSPGDGGNAPTPPSDSFILQEDGSSMFLLEDGTSLLLMES